LIDGVSYPAGIATCEDMIIAQDGLGATEPLRYAVDDSALTALDDVMQAQESQRLRRR
jgi:hypothetical protein